MAPRLHGNLSRAATLLPGSCSGLNACIDSRARSLEIEEGDLGVEFLNRLFPP